MYEPEGNKLMYVPVETLKVLILVAAFIYILIVNYKSYLQEGRLVVAHRHNTLQ